MSEKTMLERVACAISGAPFPTANSLRKARAAIEAMRDPTVTMAEAVYATVEMSDAWCIEDDQHWKRSFTAAIDAALSEHP